MKRSGVMALLCGLLLCLAGCQRAGAERITYFYLDELGLPEGQQLWELDVRGERLLLATRPADPDSSDRACSLHLKDLRDGSFTTLFTSEKTSFGGCTLLEDGTIAFEGSFYPPPAGAGEAATYYEPKTGQAATYYFPDAYYQGVFLPHRAVATWDKDGNFLYHQLATGDTVLVWPSTKAPRGHTGDPTLPVDENGRVVVDGASSPVLSPNGEYIAFTEQKDSTAIHRYTLKDGILLTRQVPVGDTNTNHTPALHFLGEQLYIFALPQDEEGYRNRYWCLDDAGLREHQTDFWFDGVHPVQGGLLLTGGGEFWLLEGEEPPAQVDFSLAPGQWLAGAWRDGGYLWLWVYSFGDGGAQREDVLVRLAL